ncbi:MAG TPA: DUF3090 family protein [Actinomycetota bacterium]|nr:DUF3090 family protein [Actinomycetota bacterium]
MSQDFDFDPAETFTTGAVGQPGRRVFMLQAGRGGEVASWVLEKEQVVAMARASYELLSQIGEHEMTKELLGKGPLGASTPQFEAAMALKADQPAFRVDGDTITMRYDDERNVIEISFSELTEVELNMPAAVRIVVTPRQLAAFGVQGMKVVGQGRPTCPLCGHPMEPDGHICPATNGHNPRAR